MVGRVVGRNGTWARKGRFGWKDKKLSSDHLQSLAAKRHPSRNVRRAVKDVGSDGIS